MANTMKRLLSFALALVMVLGLLPVVQIEAKAAEATAQSNILPMEYMVWKDMGKNANGETIWFMDVSQKNVDISKINNDLEGTPDADGKITAYCYACKKERVWNPVYDDTVMPNLNSVEEEDIHFYLAEDVETKTLNDSNEYFWWRGTNRRSCLHLNGHDLTMQTADGCGFIYVGGGTLNIMGNGTVTGNCNQNNRGSAVVANRASSGACIVNLFGGTYKSSNSKPAVSTSGPNAQLNIYPGATTEGVFQLGTTKMYGGQVNGNVTCKLGTFTMTGGTITNNSNAVTLEGIWFDPNSNVANNEYYTNATFNMNGGVINGTVTTTRTKDKTAIFEYTDANGNPATKNNTIPSEDNTGDLVFNMTNGIINGRGTKTAPVNTSGTCFFITEGGKVNISGGTVNSGWINVDTAGSYGWGGIGYFRAPTGNQNIEELQTELNISGGTFNCTGDDEQVGTRTGGLVYLYGAKSASKDDATVQAAKGVKMTVSGGIINAGRVTTDGGAIHCSGSILEITGGTITGGRAGTAGGNIYVTNATSELSISNAVITDGIADSRGGNIWVADIKKDEPRRTIDISNSTISGGKALGGRIMSDDWGYINGGGNIYLGAYNTINVSNTVISGGEAIGGGNILAKNSTVVNLNEGAVLTGGTATGYQTYYYGGNWQSNTGTININAGSRVDDGACDLNKGTSLSAMWGAKINVNGGSVGTSEEKTETTVRLYSNDSNSASKLTVNDGIVFGNITLDSTVKVEVEIKHGVFSMDPTAAAGTAVVKQNAEGLYEVHASEPTLNTVAATCTEDGYTAYTCTMEGCTGYKTNVTPKHTQTEIPAEESSCTVAGHKAYYDCSCEKYYEDAACEKEITDLTEWLAGAGALELADHAWTAKDAVTATCAAKGNVAYYDCDNCDALAVKEGEGYVEKTWAQIETEDPDNHTLGDWVNDVKSCENCDYTETCAHPTTKKVGEKTATCVTDGYTGDTKCTECGVVTETGRDISKDSIPHGTAYKAAENADQHIKYCPVEGCTWSETENHTYVDGKCVCDAAEPEKVLKGSGTEEDPYQIGTLEELILFRDDVNTETTVYGAAGVYVVLTDDINMSGIDWSKNIGDAADFSFAGIFDGKNHTITGLNSKETAADPYVCTGLFGCIEGGAVIKNLTIEGANIQAEYVGNNAGFVVGFAWEATGTIENVHVVDSTLNASAVTGTGAIVGYDYTGKLTIQNCSVGNTDVIGASYVGGIVGYSTNCTVSGCTFDGGDVTATGGCAGGVAGIMLAGSKSENNTVKNAQITAAHENWQNSAAVVVGCITGGKVTVSGTVVENVNLTALVGSQHANKPTTPVAKVQAVIGNDYYPTFDDAIKAAQTGETVKLLDNVTVTAPVVIPTGAAVDLNGKVLSGTVLGTLQMNGGLLVTAEGYKMFGVGADYYATENAELFMDAAGTVKLVSGEVTLFKAEWWSLPGQKLIVAEGATFTIPTGKVLQINGTQVVVEGTAVVDGAVNLYSVDAAIQAAEGLNVTTTVADYEVVYADGVYSLKHKQVVVVKPEADKVVVNNGSQEVTQEQKDAVENIITQVVQNQAADKVETGLTTNETANNALKEELQTKNPEITEEKLEEAVQNAQTAVFIELTEVSVSENNEATKLTYDVEPVLLYEDVKVKIENPGKIKFHLPVPGNIQPGTSVKVYHENDLLGFYAVLTDGNGHNYVEVEHDTFSPYTVEVTDAVATVNDEACNDLQMALEAAAVSGGTVKLLRNVDLGAAMVLVMDNVTLDLNGFKLTTTGYVMAVFENSYIIDSSEGNTGRLVMDLGKLRLLNDNKQLPVQTTTGILFADVKLEGRWSDKSSCYKFWFADSTDAAFIEQLKQGSAASELKVLVELSWNSGANKMTYVFTDANLADYLENWQTYSLILNVGGADSIEDLSYTAKVIFADNTDAEAFVAGSAVNHSA